MKRQFCIYLFSLSTILAIAQPTQAPIIVQNATSTRAFFTLDSAYLSSNNGDTLYLPGGTFKLNANNGKLGKRLVILGSGYRTDSSNATGVTRIENIFELQTTASKSYISGILFMSNIYGVASEVLISRCRINGQLRWDSQNDNDIFMVDKSVIIGDISFLRGRNNISNSILETSSISNVANLNPIISFSNCIFLHQIGNQSILFRDNLPNISVNNSIFYLAYQLTSRPANHVFTDNIFVGNRGFVNIDTAISRGNILQDIAFRTNVFVRQTGTTYNELHDYHLNSACNCNDKGIYSGSSPFKDVPETPYVIERQVTARPTTNRLQYRFRIRSNN